MAKILAIVNQKGGVGKTTTAVNLASYLAKQGKFTLIVDMDPQGNATSSFTLKKSHADRFSIYDAIINAAPTSVIRRETDQVGLHIIPGSRDLAGAAVELVQVPRREWQLHRVLLPIRHDYDYIIIDCPPSLDLLTVNSLTAADEVLIPVQCEYLALEGLEQLLSTINLVKNNLGHDLKIAGALLTMYNRNSRLSREVVKEVRRNFPGYVFDTVIPRTVLLAEAPRLGKTILQYAPTSPAAQAYRELAQELINLENKDICETPLAKD